ncbi:MAG TPA: tetratricopeptide repeat protein [Chitinispirillaceae bacterium]|nr:tetratricopeptide repeat protein [Chitinispirillaceae bacterium]
MIKRYWRFVLFAAVMLFFCSENSVKRGYQSLNLGDYDMAIGFFNEELHRNPGDFGARVGLGKALLQKSYATEQDTTLWHQALIQLQAARSIENRDYLNTLLRDAWIIYGRKKLAAEDTMAALTAMTFALDYDPASAEALNLSGILFSSFGLTQKAESLFVAGSNNSKSSRELQFNLGILYFYRQQYGDALRIWKSASLYDSSDIELKQWIALAEKKNDGKQAP